MKVADFRTRLHHDGRSTDNVEGVEKMRIYELKRGKIDVWEVILWIVCLLVVVFAVNEYLGIIHLDRVVKMSGLL